MRMSCNGCRVLRKGCSDSCSIRPCLQWIKSPEAQANATVFLAKFYGRAGLINLVNAGPEHLRPAIFRSLLYEACGRIVNPIYGSVGLLWSGSWQLCQAAVESVLKGAPITQISSESAVAAGVPGHKPYDIRHVAKNPDGAASVGDLHRMAAKSRGRFKRSGSTSAAADAAVAARGKLPMAEAVVEEVRPSAHSHESDGESGYSAETLEGSHVSQGEPSERTEREADQAAAAEEVGMGLDLTLSLEPNAAAARACGQSGDRRQMGSGERRVELGLSLTA